MIKGSDSKLKNSKKGTRSGRKPKVKIENPSATAEEMIIKASDAKQKASDVKNPTGRKSEGFSFRKTKIHPQLRKTKAKIHPQRWKIKTNHLPIPTCFQMRLRAVIELDQKWIT